MLEKINSIICNWDPIGLFPLAPKDEYANEAFLVYQAYQKTDGIPKLALAIYDIFCINFGVDIFKVSIDECKKIAEMIIKECN